jgi:hypothetical protein
MPNASFSDVERESRNDCKELANHAAKGSGNGSPVRHNSARVRMLWIDCSMEKFPHYVGSMHVHKWVAKNSIKERHLNERSFSYLLEP